MYTMLVLTISGSVLALLLMCLRYTVLRKMPSTVFYYAWLLVLLRFALPLPGFVPNFGETTEAAPAPAVYSEMNTQDNVRENVPEYTQKVSESVQNNVTKTAPTEATVSHISLNTTETQEMSVSETAPKASISIDWRSPKLWLSIWALGAVVSLGITVFSYLHFGFGLKKKLMEPDDFTKEVYASIPGRKPALYFSDSARTPMMLGVIKPKIVLPYREYSEELLNNILRHELTHYRRFDALYKWASVAILSVHWFNPIAWFIRRELNRACEMSCDEMLLRSMNKDEKQSYGDSLLIMAASYALPSAVVATSFATEKRNLKERLVQIMNYKKSGTRMLAAALTVVLLAGSGVAAGPVYVKSKAEEPYAGGPDFEDVTETEASDPVTGNASESETSETVTEDTSETATSVTDAENASETKASTPKANAKVVKVKNVDEFLKAIAPNTVIELAEGNYDLSKATNYDKKSNSKYYSWEHDGGEERSAGLIIKNAANLTIRGAGIGKTIIEAVPRFVNVIDFRACNNLTVSNLTAGHTKEPGLCTGGVLLVEDSSDINIDSCGLFGCGTVGVHGLNCKKLNVTNCNIYECSVSAVSTADCVDVLVSGCSIHDNGKKETLNHADSLFEAFDCTRFTVYNCKIRDNKAENLLYTRGSNKDVLFLSNEVKKNTFTAGAFHFEQACATVDGCLFEGNNGSWYKEYAKIKATDVNGKELDTAEFKAMKLRDIKPESVGPKATPTPTPALKPKKVAPGSEIHVKTIDEFLSALGSDRTIVLDETNFTPAKATGYYAGVYGGNDSDFYHWCSTPDGPQLIIDNVKNLTIKAKNSDPAKTAFEAIPRDATVLCFAGCENITLEGFTIGHTKDKGACNGGALDFEKCKNIKIENMRLYGCGGKGIDVNSCNGIDIKNTEIFDCSDGAAWFTDTNGINFIDCNIHDVKSPAILFYSSHNRTWNGQEIDPMNGFFDIKSDGTLAAADP